ncbi:hypothetical protein ACFLTD_02660 [Elusimicrobiota bacterium]
MNRFFNEKLKILHVKKAAQDIYHIRLQDCSINPLAEAGQFLHIKIADKPLRRPISIFSKGPGHLDILFKTCGAGTLQLSNCTAGDIVDVIGPLGKPFPRPEDDALFIAGGLGIAPINFLAESTDSKYTILYGTKKEQDFIEPDFLQDQENNLIKISEEKNNKTVCDILTEYIEDTDMVYAAGPRPMLKKISDICMTGNISGYISWEERMGCGIGLCQGCAVKTASGYRKTCSEGPVFSITEIDWNEY